MSHFLRCSIKIEKTPFFRDRQASGTCTYTHRQQTGYTQTSNHMLQREDTRRKKFKFGLDLDQIILKGHTFFSFLNVTSMHFGASEIIFNVLTDTSAFVCCVHDIFQRLSIGPSMVSHCQRHPMGLHICV